MRKGESGEATIGEPFGGGFVPDVCKSRDEKVIVSTSCYRIVQMWNGENGETIGESSTAAVGIKAVSMDRGWRWILFCFKQYTY